MVKAIYKPSRKMKQVYTESRYARHRILEGAVRSSKSFVANDIALKEIQELPPCNVLISGYSISSAARNVVSEWREMIDPKGRGLFRNRKEGKDDYLSINWRGLKNKRFYIRGAAKESDFKQIQGSTFGYWLNDEASRHHETFVDMAMTRLSLPFSKSIWTTNPDSPFHYIKTRFLDNKEIYKEDRKGFSEFKSWKFFLRDNPSLTKEYIEGLKRIYSGVFYKRFIQSLWVIAEGTIYDFFDDSIHVLSRYQLPKAESYVIGIDYGTSNPTCFILFGINMNAHPKIWAEREYYFDSRRSQRQKTDSEYSIDLRKFIGKENKEISKIILDPSAASFKVQLIKDGFYSVKDASNDVLDGIRTQSRMLKLGEYAICNECTQTIADYNAYVWDSKAQLRGEDKPLKQNDHTKDVERYVLYTLFGKRKIDYNILTAW